MLLSCSLTACVGGLVVCLLWTIFAGLLVHVSEIGGLQIFVANYERILMEC